ncbi:HlyD family secretion protein [Desulfatibacillum alkenivorans DSM 16219]|jgi:HlyD family secretion protein|uniref:HlyD family secretion protein n=1 Tax=Desulfatibacillum alkenivorans DSM 16219 TaxID=1121393 RepID=A0A1M6IBP0_9BACT|nr:efflux RND transporter periplasmic adaptor subunit [Desulfatibacillum alkenivorans]SHJ31909.1 HlyD family secretion protein [Desulfatibacillum alkenivorans DSM 16219]
MKKTVRLIILVLIVGGGLTWAFFFREKDDPNLIKMSGNIEVVQVDLGFELSGILAERLADEGETVSKGDLLARLDDSNYILQVQQAKAELGYAQAVLEELEAGSRPEEIAQAKAMVSQREYALKELLSGSRAQEIKEAAAALDQAKAGALAAESKVALAKADYERYHKIFESGGISIQAVQTYETQMDIAQRGFEEAKARVQAANERLHLVKEGPRQELIRQARAALEQAEADYELVKAGPRKENIAQAKARVESAGEAVKIAEKRVRDSLLKAPFDGVILAKSAEPGAYMNPGTPVVTLAQMDPVWLRAFVSERDLGRIRLGMEVEVSTDAYPGKKYPGALSFISSESEFTPKSVQTFEERLNLMYRVKIELSNPDMALKPGMPADAVIRITQ